MVPEEDTRNPALPQTSFTALHPLPLLPAVPWEKAIFVFTHRLRALRSNADLLLRLRSTCSRLVYVLTKQPSTLGQPVWYFQDKAFL